MNQPVYFNPVKVETNDLLNIKKQVARFTLKETNKKAYTGWGQAKSPFKSKGLDFQEVRVYQPGDDIRQIDWRVTAKYGKPFTKLYTDEKERQVFLICDMRSCMKFATRGAFKSVWCARVAALLAFLAQNKQDRLGFSILLADKIESGRLFNAKEAFDGLIQLLSRASDPSDIKEDTITLTQALKASRPLVKDGSLIFIISDFSDWDDEALNIVQGWSLKSTCGFLHIYDPLEQTFPQGVFPVSNGKEIFAVDSRVAGFSKNFASVFEKRQENLLQAARRLEIGYAPMRTDEDVLLKVFRYCIGEKNATGY